MIFMSLLGACIVYGIGDIPFIDALFFGAGAATQSGLNTYDNTRCLFLYGTNNR